METNYIFIDALVSLKAAMQLHNFSGAGDEIFSSFCQTTKAKWA